MDTKHKVVEALFTVCVGVILYFGFEYIFSFFALGAPQIVPGIKLFSFVLAGLAVGYRLRSIFFQGKK